MVKMVGNFECGKLVNKLINENIQVKKENKELKLIIHTMEQQFKDYYSEQENIDETIEMASGGNNSVELTEAFNDSSDSDELVQAWNELNINSTDYLGFENNTYCEV